MYIGRFVRRIGNHSYGIYWGHPRQIVRRPLIPAFLFSCFCLYGWPAAPETIYEAEDADIQAPAEIVTHDGARGGRCVQLSESNAIEHQMKTGAAATKLGRVTFHVDSPEDGAYAVWARLRWHCGCGRGVLVRAGNLGSETDQAPISSNAPPLVWHWAKVGTYPLKKGRQDIEFAQWGHLVLLDAIAISADPRFRPPGFIDEAQVFALNEKAYWQAQGSADVHHRLGDRDWSYFDLHTVISIPEAESHASYGIAFGIAGGKRYELRLLRRTEDRSLTLTLVRVDDGKETVLATRERLDGAGTDHLISALYVGPRIFAAVDGFPALSLEEAAPISGAIEVVTHGAAGVQVDETRITSLESYEEHFVHQPVGWKETAGEWRLFKPDAVEGSSNLLLCKAGSEALFRSNWVTGDNFGLCADVKLPGAGAAGLAFNITDDSYCAFLLKSADGPGGGSEKLALTRVSKGRSEVLWSGDGKPNRQQWRRLAVNKANAYLELSVDDVVVARLRSGMWSAFDRGVGLAASNVNGACFSSVRSTTGSTLGDSESTFWPPTNSSSLCQWKVDAGAAAFNEYSGALVVTSSESTGSAALTFRKPVQGANSVEVEFGFIKNEAETTGAAAALPQLALPVMPDDPRLSIELASMNGQTRYKASFDIRDARDVLLFKNGTSVGHGAAPHPAALADRDVYLRVDGTKVVAGIKNGPHTEFEDKSLSSGESEWRVILLLEHGNRESPLRLTRIVVGKTCSLISSVPRGAQ